MNKTFKKVITYILIAIVGVILAAALLPFVFKDKIIKKVKDTANENILATVDFADADISFLKSFPDIQIQIDSLSIMGRDTFDGIVLYKAPVTKADVSLSSFFGDNVPKINSVYTKNPEINVVNLNAALNNYTITKDNGTETSAYQLQIQEYEIEDGNITYQDNEMNLFVVANHTNHSGSGDFTQDIFDLNTKTDIENLRVRYEGTDYLKNSKASLSAKININFPDEKYTLLDNVLKINELDLTGNGFVQFKNDDIYVETTFESPSESFKSFASILPNAYTKDYNQVKSAGSARISGSVKGIYNSSKQSMPAFDIKVNIKDGMIKYPSFPQEIKNVFLDMQVQASRPDYKDMTLKIPQFSLNIGSDPIKGQLLASNLLGNQQVSGKLLGTLNLKNIKDAYPMPDMENIAGWIKCDLEFGANMKDINQENYAAIQFKGNGTVNSLLYKGKNMPQISINNGTFEASPSEVVLKANEMKLGKSDLNMLLIAKNPLAVFSTEKSVKASIQAQSDFFDMNEWMMSPQPSSEHPKATALPDVSMLENSDMTLDVKAKKVLFQQHTIENLALDGNIAANAIKLNNVSAKIGSNDFHVDGRIINAFNYFFNNEILDGDLHLSSNYLNTNDFMTAQTTNSTDSYEVIPVPERVRMTMKADIKELIYTNLNMKDFKGMLDVKNREVALHQMETNTLGGKLALQGLYNTTNLAKPDFSIKLDLSKIKFAEAFTKMDVFKKAAPIAEYIDGMFNTSLVMQGKLGEKMMPDLSMLDASGLIETLSGSIRGFKPISELSNLLGIKELNDINLANSKNWFNIIQGFVELKEYSTKVKGIDLTISGKHGFGKEMQYNIDLVIPRELLKKNKITNIGETGWGMVEKEASKLGININQGSQIFLNVKMTGTLKKPIFKITPKTSKGQSMAENIETTTKDMIAKAKDSIQMEIKKKEAQMKDTITKRANEELEKVKTQAEKVAEKAIDTIKTKAKEMVLDKLDTLTKGAIPDSLKQKAKDVMNKKTTEEVDKIKEKLKDFNPFKKKGNG
jgi:hypothetical protein